MPDNLSDYSRSTIQQFGKVSILRLGGVSPIEGIIISEQSKLQKVQKHVGLPLVYNKDYNIRAPFLRKFLPPDLCKYQNIHDILIEDGNRDREKDFYIVQQRCSRGIMLTLGVSELYLLSLCYCFQISRLIKIPYQWHLPGAYFRSNILNPMLYATQGSIDAGILAIQRGWAINIGGGYHHASLNNGGGFCIYPDITITIKYLRKYQGVKKVIILDLDAHQGNGYERDFKNDEQTFIIDFYNHNIYPQDYSASLAIKVDVPVSYQDSDQIYNDKLRNTIRDCFQEQKPDFILYNAGTDCMENDPLGQMQLTQQGIRTRDDIVFYEATKANIPILMVLSGGYQMINAPTIASSINNLLDKYQNRNQYN